MTVGNVTVTGGNGFGGTGITFGPGSLMLTNSTARNHISTGGNSGGVGEMFTVTPDQDVRGRFEVTVTC